MSTRLCDPAFDAKYDSLDKDSPGAIRLSLGDWTAARHRLMEPLMAPHQAHLCDEISRTLMVFRPYANDSIEIIAHMYALAAQACSDLEAAWHCLGGCFVRTAHAALRSSLEATLTAVTFADPDDGAVHMADYVADRTRVSGVARRFEATAPKLAIPQAEVDFIRDYLSDWLHPLTHPAAKSTNITIIPLPKGVAIGNYFDDSRAASYTAVASNIANVARRVRVLFETAVPAAYLRRP